MASSHDITKASTVITTIKYFVAPPDGVRLFQNIFPDPITGETKNNVMKVSREVVIENVKGREDDYSLDRTGFQWFHAPSRMEPDSFLNDEEIKRVYYPETIEYYKKFTGASKVVIFDHTVRKNEPGHPGGELAQAIPHAHVDQSAKGALARVYLHVPDEADELVKRRFQIVNLWRPIGRPALDWPLAVCDYRTVDTEKDILPIALVYPDREGETYGVTYSPSHKWKYLKGMSPEEIILIKCSDSIEDNSVAVFTPHSAFPDPTTPSDAPPRESIEIRALVFYD